MKNEFIPYEEALALKELGFDEKCWMTWLYEKLERPSSFGYRNSQSDDDLDIAAPLYQQVFRWFRKKGLDSYIKMEYSKMYFSYIWNGVVWEMVGEGTYEESELECLKKLIEIVKEK